MADGAPTAKDAERFGDRGLTYPLGAPPVAGEAVEVAPGVLWMRLPLPMALDHINVYALADGDGWALVDSGLDTADSRAAWDLVLAGPLAGKPVTRVICTHMHPDHIGLAGWLCARFGAPLFMSRLEYVTARMLIADTGRSAPEEGVEFHRAAGWTEAQLERYRTGFGMFGRAVMPLPSAFHRMAEGDVIRIGDGDWRVVVGTGHSPEHVCLWREADGLILSGDQILPKISSNVSVFATEPAADPLGDWLASLERLQVLFDDSQLVLPSHGEPFRGAAVRLEALTRGHRAGLRRLERTLARPCRAVDVFAALFARPIRDGNLGMATGEALAHLNYLEKSGRVSRVRDEAGVDWWRAVQREDAA